MPRRTQEGEKAINIPAGMTWTQSLAWATAGAVRLPHMQLQRMRHEPGNDEHTKINTRMYFTHPH